MANKLKKPQSSKPKFNSEQMLNACHIKQPHVLISFAFVTSKKQYNFNHYKKELRNELNARRALDELLEFITKRSWVELAGIPKEQLGGYETMAWDVIQSQHDLSIDGVILAPDTKVHVFRFGSRDYRVVGLKDTACHEMKIIAYDFDHSLYQHGS